jgi:hypothetical protein
LQAQIEPTPKSELETAGPELDAWICENLFGVPMPPDSEAPGVHSSRLNHKSQCWYWSHEPGKQGWIPYNWSSSIREAWRVVERMHGLGWMYEITDRWCRFYTKEPSTWKAKSDTTAPLGICLAVKRALEGA